ncbi:hypothetical protein ACIRN4_19725 [Pimelobacter simplex]|uniref:hypothetical protein n=1 Tax=Nocardioides simplex TaxID=2045 RepID=UPI0037FCADEE
MLVTARARWAAVLMAAGAAVTTVVATPALASAADYTHVDASRDARSDRLDSADDSPGRLDRREASVDIRKIRVAHTADHVVVKIRTRAALPTRAFFVGVSLRTPGGDSYDAGYFKMLGSTRLDLTRGNDTVECAGLRTDIDRPRRLTTIVVPTTCIGSPAWVRAGVGAARFDRKRMWADDGLRDRQVRDELRYSPRIARG